MTFLATIVSVWYILRRGDNSATGCKAQCVISWSGGGERTEKSKRHALQISARGRQRTGRKSVIFWRQAFFSLLFCALPSYGVGLLRVWFSSLWRCPPPPDLTDAAASSRTRAVRCGASVSIASAIGTIGAPQPPSAPVSRGGFFHHTSQPVDLFFTPAPASASAPGNNRKVACSSVVPLRSAKGAFAQSLARTTSRHITVGGELRHFIEYRQIWRDVSGIRLP